MGLVEYDSDSNNEAPSPPVTHASKRTTSTYQPVRSPSPPRAPPKPAVREPTPPVPCPSSVSPVVGPSRPPAESPSPQPLEAGIGENALLSPYTLTRNEIHSLTLPPSIPDIPPSPPGSPTPSLAQKFANFRNLKAQGVHFNEKLVRSSALRNPNLLQKLTAFVGFTSADQYSSNLPAELWNPPGFPKEAFSEELAKSQGEIGNERRERETKEKQEKVEFVRSAEAYTSTVPPRGGDARMSAAERIMKGLDREQKSTTPPVGRENTRKRDGRREERDGGERNDGKRDDRREDGRDRKRRRSRSWSRDRDHDRDRRVRDYEYRDRR